MITRGLGAVVFAGVLLGGKGGAAFAQSNPTFLLVTTGEVSPSSPQTTVEVWATWEEPAPMDFMFAGANYDLRAGDGEFTSAHVDLMATGNSAGMLAGSRVVGAALGQILLDPTICYPCNRNNPLKLAHYSWETTDFTPRTVEMVTENTQNFRVYDYPFPNGTINLMSTFTPGSGSIRVVPGPGVVGVLGVGGLVAVRRRRVL
jgi:MYXO-CTERM domain-containing protein